MDRPIPLLMNNFSPFTILATGACLQSLLSLALPFRYAFLPAFFLLLLPIANTALISFGYKHNHYEDSIRVDKWTAQVPDKDGVPKKAGDKGVVVFVIGASSNHPMGAFANGFRTTADYFMGMFKDIEANPAKWGYLGRSNPLIEVNPSGSFTTCTLTYWQSMEHLHAFAHAPVHREGWSWWDQYSREHRDVGIYHETYFSPKGNWEIIYENMQPFGMGKIRYPVAGGEKGQGQPISGLVPAQEVRYRGMANRMAREEGIAAPM